MCPIQIQSLIRLSHSTHHSKQMGWWVPLQRLELFRIPNLMVVLNVSIECDTFLSSPFCVPSIKETNEKIEENPFVRRHVPIRQDTQTHTRNSYPLCKTLYSHNTAIARNHNNNVTPKNRSTSNSINSTLPNTIRISLVRNITQFRVLAGKLITTAGRL